MACARVLSTSELGLERYATAAAAGLWPVEVRYRDVEAALHNPAAVRLRATAHGEADEQTLPFARAARAEWIVFLAVPVGPLRYSVVVGESVVAAGGLDVTPPAQPLSYSPGMQNLRHSAASCASVEEDAVRFRFVERVFEVRHVYVEASALADPHRMTAATDAKGDDIFTADLKLPAGKHAFRFRVVLKEPARPDAAPFTALGWDPAQSHSGGLATWEQVIEVPAGMGKARGAAKSTAAQASFPTSGASKRMVKAAERQSREAERKSKAAAAAAATEARAPTRTPASTNEGGLGGGKIGLLAALGVGLVAVGVGLSRGSGDDCEGKEERERRLSVREKYLEHSKGQGGY